MLETRNLHSRGRQALLSLETPRENFPEWSLQLLVPVIAGLWLHHCGLPSPVSTSVLFFLLCMYAPEPLPHPCQHVCCAWYFCECYLSSPCLQENRGGFLQSKARGHRGPRRSWDLKQVLCRWKGSHLHSHSLRVGMQKPLLWKIVWHFL